MGEGNLTPSFEEVNYSLLSVTSDPGEMMEQILPAKQLKDETGTAIRDFTSHLIIQLPEMARKWAVGMRGDPSLPQNPQHGHPWPLWNKTRLGKRVLVQNGTLRVPLLSLQECPWVPGDPVSPHTPNCQAYSTMILIQTCPQFTFN